MKKYSICFLILFILFGSGVSTDAYIFLSGTTAIEPWGRLGNERFFMNILQDGDTVKALESNYVNFHNAVNDFYNYQPGTVSSVVSGTTTAALLNGVDLFIAPIPNDAFTEDEISAFRNFLAGGGSIFFVGTGANVLFRDNNTYINEALASLGSSLRIDGSQSFDGGEHTASGSQIENDPFTEGVVSFIYGGYVKVEISNGGKYLFYGTGEQSPPIIAYEPRIFRYYFSPNFYNHLNPFDLWNQTYPEDQKTLSDAAQAITQAINIWAGVVNNQIQFEKTENEQDADIVLEGWSAFGPQVSMQGGNGQYCLDSGSPYFVFNEKKDASGFTVFEDCPSDLEKPAKGPQRKARIFFHYDHEYASGLISVWSFRNGGDEIEFVGELDIVQIAAHEIGHALGFMHPNKIVFPDECENMSNSYDHYPSLMCPGRSVLVSVYKKLGGNDDIENIGLRDLTIFDKERLIENFFPGTTGIYGKVTDYNGTSINGAYISTQDSKYSTYSNTKGIYSIWKILPAHYSLTAKKSGYVNKIYSIDCNSNKITIRNFELEKESIISKPWIPLLLLIE